MKKSFFIILSLIVSAANVHALSLADFKYDFNGDLKLGFFYRSEDYPISHTGYDFSSFDTHLQKDSNIGVSFNIAMISAIFEMRVDDYLSRYYASVDFGNAGSLGFGKNYVLSQYDFGQVSFDSNSLRNFGNLNKQRLPQIRYTVKGFAFAVLSRDDDPLLLIKDPNLPADQSYGKHNNEYSIPRFDLSYEYSTKNLYFKIFGTFATFVSEWVVFQETDGNIQEIYANQYSIFGYHVGFGGKYTFGDVAYIHLSAFYANNAYMYGALTNEKLKPQINTTNRAIMNEVMSLGGAMGLGLIFTNRFTAEAGVGYMLSYSDTFKHSDNDLGYYIQLRYHLNKWVTITPEFAIQNYLNDGNGKDEGLQMYGGVQFRFKFG